MSLLSASSFLSVPAGRGRASSSFLLSAVASEAVALASTADVLSFVCASPSVVVAVVADDEMPAVLVTAPPEMAAASSADDAGTAEVSSPPAAVAEAEAS